MDRNSAHAAMTGSPVTYCRQTIKVYFSYRYYYNVIWLILAEAKSRKEKFWDSLISPTGVKITCLTAGAAIVAFPFKSKYFNIL